MSEILRENGAIKAKVTTDKYGTELQTTKGSGWWAGHAMTPKLAKLTIEVLQEYLGNTREPQWISVDDRLPPYKAVLLLWRPIDHKKRPYHWEIITGQMAHESTVDVWANGRRYDIGTHITHWIPLPSPPKEQSNVTD